MFFQIGFLVASLLTGYFTDKKGLKIMMLIGSLMMAVGLVGTSLAFSVLLFFGFYLIVGLGHRLDAGLHHYRYPDLLQRKSRHDVQRFQRHVRRGDDRHSADFTAAFLSSCLMAPVLCRVAIIVAIIILVLSSLKLEKAQGMDMQLSDFVHILGQRRLMLVIGFILFYVAAEAAFLNFFPIFYSSLDIAGASAEDKMVTAAYVISSFAMLFTVGRFIGGFINLKLGDRKTLILFSLFSLIAIIASRYFASQFVYLFMVFGFAMSVLFPTASAVATKLTDKSGSTMGLIYVASGMGGAFAGLADRPYPRCMGVSLGFNLIIAFVAIFFVLTLFVKENPQN